MDETILFSHPDLDYGYLSNDYMHRFQLDGWNWPSVEHYYQANKFTALKRIYHEIRECKEPADARRYARHCKHFVSKDWEKKRLDVMSRAVLEKFRSSEDLTQSLLKTAPAVLVDTSKKDTYWGYEGENQMGKVLMETREILSLIQQSA